MAKILTTAEFIERAKKVHGDKYDYSKIDYVNSRTKVAIICPEHGEFEQIPDSHLRGKGCAACSYEQRSQRRVAKTEERSGKATEEYIAQARTVHGGKYSYEKTVFKRVLDKVIITCPVHGDFEQTARDHLRGHECVACGYIKASDARRIDTEEFITKAKAIHGNKYDYSKSVYAGTHEKLIIVCPEHGEFEQIPTNHIDAKQGCITCGRNTLAQNLTMTTEYFIKKAQSVHGDRYDYSKVNYANSGEKVTIVCSEHGEFEQSPDGHYNGQGCPDCALTGFQPSEPAILYYLRIQDMTRTVYKIGITNRTVEDRFKSYDLDKITVLKITHFDNGSDCYDAEQDIIKQYADFKYTGEDVLADGNTELFTRDVLGLDDYSE